MNKVIWKIHVRRLTLGYFIVKWLSKFSSSNGSTPISGLMTDTPGKLSSKEIRSDFRYRTHFLQKNDVCKY